MERRYVRGSGKIPAGLEAEQFSDDILTCICSCQEFKDIEKAKNLGKSLAGISVTNPTIVKILASILDSNIEKIDEAENLPKLEELMEDIIFTQNDRFKGLDKIGKGMRSIWDLLVVSFEQATVSQQDVLIALEKCFTQIPLCKENFDKFVIRYNTEVIKSNYDQLKSDYNTVVINYVKQILEKLPNDIKIGCLQKIENKDILSADSKALDEVIGLLGEYIANSDSEYYSENLGDPKLSTCVEVMKSLKSLVTPSCPLPVGLKEQMMQRFGINDLSESGKSPLELLRQYRDELKDKMESNIKVIVEHFSQNVEEVDYRGEEYAEELVKSLDPIPSREEEEDKLENINSIVAAGVIAAFVESARQIQLPEINQIIAKLDRCTSSEQYVQVIYEALRTVQSLVLDSKGEAAIAINAKLNSDEFNSDTINLITGLHISREHPLSLSSGDLNNLLTILRKLNQYPERDLGKFRMAKEILNQLLSYPELSDQQISPLLEKISQLKIVSLDSGKITAEKAFLKTMLQLAPESPNGSNLTMAESLKNIQKVIELQGELKKASWSGEDFGTLLYMALDTKGDTLDEFIKMLQKQKHPLLLSSGDFNNLLTILKELDRISDLAEHEEARKTLDELLSYSELKDQISSLLGKISQLKIDSPNSSDVTMAESLKNIQTIIGLQKGLKQDSQQASLSGEDFGNLLHMALDTKGATLESFIGMSKICPLLPESFKDLLAILKGLDQISDSAKCESARGTLEQLLSYPELTDQISSLLGKISQLKIDSPNSSDVTMAESLKNIQTIIGLQKGLKQDSQQASLSGEDFGTLLHMALDTKGDTLQSFISMSKLCPLLPESFKNLLAILKRLDQIIDDTERDSARGTLKQLLSCQELDNLQISHLLETISQLNLVPSNSSNITMTESLKNIQGIIDLQNRLKQDPWSGEEFGKLLQMTLGKIRPLSPESFKNLLTILKELGKISDADNLQADKCKKAIGTLNQLLDRPDLVDDQRIFDLLSIGSQLDNSEITITEFLSSVQEVMDLQRNSKQGSLSKEELNRFWYMAQDTNSNNHNRKTFEQIKPLLEKFKNQGINVDVLSLVAKNMLAANIGFILEPLNELAQSNPSELNRLAKLILVNKIEGPAEVQKIIEMLKSEDKDRLGLIISILEENARRNLTLNIGKLSQITSIINVGNLERLRNLYSKRPSPSIKQMLELCSVQSSEMNNRIAEFERNPYGVRDDKELYDLTKINRVLTELKGNNPNRFTDEQLEEIVREFQYINGYGVKAKTLGADEIKERIQRLRTQFENFKLNSAQKYRLRLEGIALLREAMYRVTGKMPNSMQIMSVLLTAKFSNNLSLQINSRDNSSVKPMLAALEWLGGKTVNVVIADSKTVDDDFKADADFWTYLGINAGLPKEEGTAPEEKGPAPEVKYISKETFDEGSEVNDTTTTIDYSSTEITLNRQIAGVGKTVDGQDVAKNSIPIAVCDNQNKADLMRKQAFIGKAMNFYERKFGDADTIVKVGGQIDLSNVYINARSKFMNQAILLSNKYLRNEISKSEFGKQMLKAYNDCHILAKLENVDPYTQPGLGWLLGSDESDASKQLEGVRLLDDTTLAQKVENKEELVESEAILKNSVASLRCYQTVLSALVPKEIKELGEECLSSSAKKKEAVHKIQDYIQDYLNKKNTVDGAAKRADLAEKIQEGQFTGNCTIDYLLLALAQRKNPVVAYSHPFGETGSLKELKRSMLKLISQKREQPESSERAPSP